MSANEGNALLRAANAEIREAAETQRAAMDDLLEATTWFHQAISKSETSRRHLSEALDLYSSVLSQYASPATIDELEG